jgi:hypothetical protein
MMSLRSELESRLPRDWRHPLARRSRESELGTKFLIAGVVAVGIGFLAWHYLGPDLRRYMKIHNM